MTNYSISCFCSFIFLIRMPQTISVINRSGMCYFLHASDQWHVWWQVQMSKYCRTWISKYVYFHSNFHPWKFGEKICKITCQSFLLGVNLLGSFSGKMDKNPLGQNPPSPFTRGNPACGKVMVFFMGVKDSIYDAVKG